MTSSSFQTSRLKTVSKRPRRSFPLCRCVFVHVLALVFGCVSTSVCVCVFFLSLASTGVFVLGESACGGVCFSMSLSTLTFAHTSTLWRAAAVLRVCRQVHEWGVVSFPLSVCLSLYLSLPSFCYSHHHWDIIALWFICINIKILWQIFF